MPEQKRIIDGKEYTQIDITSININGEERENSFTIEDIDEFNRINFDIKVNADLSTNI